MTNKRRVLSALALVLTIALAQPLIGQKKSSASDSIKIPFETYKLPNGLTVILSEDRTTPTVAVNIWYHVGSKNEMPGRTGFAHLFEHVMFTGSGNVPMSPVRQTLPWLTMALGALCAGFALSRRSAPMPSPIDG